MKIPFISATLGVVMITTAFKMDVAIHNAPSNASEFESKPFWADEFDKKGLPDAKKWGYDIGGSGWGNHELEYYTKENLKNARVENGKLIIEAIKEPFEGKNYTSARLTSKGKADFLYGRFEVKAKLPKGLGTWPAIWMLATDHSYGESYWPDNGEIDIMEHVGYDPNVIHASVHTKSYYHSIGTQKTAVKTIPTAMTEYHVYRIDWTPEKIDSYIDGELYFTFKNEKTGWKEWPFDKKQHILLNLAVGGDWGGQKGVDDSIFPQKMEIDYVRVYKMKK